MEETEYMTIADIKNRLLVCQATARNLAMSNKFTVLKIPNGKKTIYRIEKKSFNSWIEANSN